MDDICMEEKHVSTQIHIGEQYIKDEGQIWSRNVKKC